MPTAVLMHTLHRYHTHGWSRSPIGVIAAARGMRPGKLWNAADRVLVATDSALDPATEGQLPRNVRYTGVVQAPIQPGMLKEKPIVLVSLSTLFFEGQEATLQAVLDAVDGLSIGVIVTTGAVAHEALRVPANVELHQYVPHDQIMPSVSLVIGHGGHSTTVRALAHGYRCSSCQCTGSSTSRWLGRPWPRRAPGGFCPRLLLPGTSGARCGRSWRNQRTDTLREPQAPVCVRAMGRLPPPMSSKVF